MNSSNMGQARAAALLGRVNLAIIKAAATRRQAQVGHYAGARAMAGMAAGRVRLVVIEGGKASTSPSTPPGYRTARRAPPRVLASLPEGDRRLAVARMLADAVERVGAVRGIDLAGSDSKGGLSDGGATTRIKHAARYRMIEALANGWPIGGDGRHVQGPPRPLLSNQRAGGDRFAIMAFPALLALCVEGQSLDAILRAHGWSAQAFNRTRLRDAVLEVLGEVADGIARPGRRGCLGLT